MRAARFYLFLKWFKQYHPEIYLLYGMHINVPGKDMRISVSIDYIDPRHKLEILKIIKEYNEGTLD